MKSILNSVLPAMALLTLGGCASTSALTSTESDGVYYSSKDRTTYNEPARSTAAAPSDAAESTASDAETNPDYASTNSSSSSRSGGSEYYDDDYGYSARIRRFHQPAYRSFGYGYNDFIYSDPFWYGGSAYYGGYSPYGWGPGYYGALYDPFYGPYYGGSAVVINIGFGRPYYNPWRYGYGGYGYGYADGYRNGLYNSGYGGYGGYGNYYGGSGGAGTSRRVTYGPRTGRSVEAVTAGQAAGTSSGRGRVREGGLPGGSTNVQRASNDAATATPSWNGRSRTGTTEDAASGVNPAVRSGGRSRSGSDQVLRRDNAVFEDGQGARVESSGTDAANQPRTTESNGRRWRVVENTGNAAGSQPAATPTYPNYSEQRRSRSREVVTGEQQNVGSEATPQAQPARRQRSSEAPQRVYEAPQRTYEAPQRTYEAPTRSYSEPSRSSSPSMNSGDGGGGGGGRSGGGRGRGE